MDEKIHHRKSIRLQGHDYSGFGWYFITICTKNRECVFGEIKDEKMILSDMGKMAHKYWLEIPEHFNDIKLDEFVIMPNHVHGIIIIDVPLSVGDRHACPLPGAQKRNIQKLPSIIGSYKSTVTREIRKQFDNHKFGWQRSYHDRIIRNNDELDRIREYIYYNPAKFEIILITICKYGKNRYYYFCHHDRGDAWELCLTDHLAASL